MPFHDFSLFWSFLSMQNMWATMYINFEMHLFTPPPLQVFFPDSTSDFYNMCVVNQLGEKIALFDPYFLGRKHATPPPLFFVSFQSYFPLNMLFGHIFGESRKNIYPSYMWQPSLVIAYKPLAEGRGGLALPYFPTPQPF